MPVLCTYCSDDPFTFPLSVSVSSVYSCPVTFIASGWAWHGIAGPCLRFLGPTIGPRRGARDVTIGGCVPDPG